MKRIIRFLAIACLFWVAAGCDGLTPSKPNLYVDVDDASRGEELYFITYIREGATGHSGQNIINKQHGTFTFKGEVYRVFAIPRGIWDIYMEWTANYANADWMNDRRTVNLRDNEWARIQFYSEKDHTSCWVYQGSGEMY